MRHPLSAAALLSGRPVEEYPEYSREPDGGAGIRAAGAGGDLSGRTGDAFPDEPQPRIVTREPIERQPLDGGTGLGPAMIRGTDGPAVTCLRAGARVAGLQVLLDRKGASPGVIDGHFGSNVDKALAAYRDITGPNLHSTDTEAIKKALAETGGDAFTTYTITAEDAAGPFVASVPADYGARPSSTG